MKICPACKSIINDNARICDSCGFSFDSTQSNKPSYRYGALGNSGSNETAKKTVGILTSTVRNPLFLFILIFFSLTTLLSAVSIVFDFNNISTAVKEISGLPVFLDFLKIVNSSADTVLLMFFILFILTTAVESTGFWRFLATAKGESFKTHPLNIVKTTCKIKISLISILFIAFEALLIICLMNVSSFPSFDKGKIYIYMLFTAVIYFALFFYYIEIIKTIRIIQATVKKGIPTGTISPYIFIVNFLLVLLCTIVFLNKDIFFIATVLSFLIFNVLSTIEICIYNKTIRKFGAALDNAEHAPEVYF